MARELQIDTDTYVGYNYKEKLYYVRNKGTETTRITGEQIIEVLKVVTGKYPHQVPVTQDTPPVPITPAYLEETLVTPYEKLTDLYYTWEDTGAYVKTLQLNTYEENPLVLDCDKKKLYIMNTNLIYDLETNEADTYRTPYLIAYYKDTLGLDVTVEEMNYIYDFLMSFYSPTNYPKLQPYEPKTFYNVFSERETNQDPLFYSDTFKLSDYDNNAKAEITCTYNPDNSFPSSNKLTDIIYIDPNTRSLQLMNQVLTLKVGDTVTISGADVDMSGETYTDDGDYTVEAIEDTILIVKEPLAISYAPAYKMCYKVASELHISEIDKDTLTISFTSSPTSLQEGDKIQVTGTTITGNDETVSADGEYTVVTVNAVSNYVVVMEIPAISYTGSSGMAYRYEPFAYIQEITNNQVVLFGELPSSAPEKVLIDDQMYVVTDYSQITRRLVLATQPPSYSLTLPELVKKVPSDVVDVEVTASSLPEVPTGTFRVDSFLQCQQYVLTIFATADGVDTYPVPDYIKTNILGEWVSMTMQIKVRDSVGYATSNTITAQCRGLYSDVYSGDLLITDSNS